MQTAVLTRPLALIVDHDRGRRELYAEYFCQHGINTAEAGDGLQALAKATTLLPDVITAKSRLPRLDGEALCQRLKSQDLTRDIPVIVVDEGASPADIARATDAGCASVLATRCLPETLLAEIHRILNRP